MIGFLLKIELKIDSVDFWVMPSIQILLYIDWLKRCLPISEKNDTHVGQNPYSCPFSRDSILS